MYELCLSKAVRFYTAPENFENKEFRNVPDNVLFDFYHLMYDQDLMCQLVLELSEWPVFARMLTVKQCWVDLLRIFQGLLNVNKMQASNLVHDYKFYAEDASNREQMIEMGLNFAVFLVEGAWYNCAFELLNCIHEYICEWKAEDSYRRKLIYLECLQRRLYVETNYAFFDYADRTFHSCQELQRRIEREASETRRKLPNLATLYATYTHLFTMRSEYDTACTWGLKAIALLNSDLSKSACLYVLRIVAKVCVMKRRYSEGNFLIQQALMLAKELYEVDLHPNFADTLMVYGFFLLNHDNIRESLEVYKKALNVRVAVFGKNNIHVAFAYEELAYAHYVHEYSSGDFQKALEYANKATRILSNLLPPHHLSLAYTKRVKGLIVEEIALDLREPSEREQRALLLLEAEMLHKSALSLSKRTFGLENVQTAKHYGNLGRVYQSMDEYQEAERMQLIAIRIKESILGNWDYEVGLSMGHLASLYNFHMKRFKDAEHYYLRSIEIGKNLFGESYSGLEYDYRGLIKVYTQLEQPELVEKYKRLMQTWRAMRQMPASIVRYTDMLPIPTIVQLFLNWDKQKAAAD